MPLDLNFSLYLPITAGTAGSLALLLVLLALATVRRRLRAGVSIGDGQDLALARLRRSQANFTEYVPLALVLMALVELNLGSGTLISITGAGLVIGRVLHAWGLGRSDAPNAARVAGTALTLVCISLLAAALLYQALVSRL